MKKVLILLVLLLLLGGGGGAYYYFFVLTAEEVVEVEPPPPPPDIRFVDLSSIRIPVMRGGEVVNYVILDVSLETIGPENEEQATTLMPRLRNALLTDLMGYFAAVPVEDRLMVKGLKRRMQILSDRILGPGTVNDILIRNAFKQRG